MADPAYHADKPVETEDVPSSSSSSPQRHPSLLHTHFPLNLTHLDGVWCLACFAVVFYHVHFVHGALFFLSTERCFRDLRHWPILGNLFFEVSWHMTTFWMISGSQTIAPPRLLQYSRPPRNYCRVVLASCIAYDQPTFETVSGIYSLCRVELSGTQGAIRTPRAGYGKLPLRHFGPLGGRNLYHGIWQSWFAVRGARMDFAKRHSRSLGHCRVVCLDSPKHVLVQWNTAGTGTAKETIAMQTTLFVDVLCSERLSDARDASLCGTAA